MGAQHVQHPAVRQGDADKGSALAAVLHRMDDDRHLIAGRERALGPSQLGYFSNTDQKDPLVSPINSPEILAKFPPTLLITGTRDFAFSGTLFTDTQLTKQGVDVELHVWEGLFHGFFYNADVPESRDALNVIVNFFDRKLASK